MLLLFFFFFFFQAEDGIRDVAVTGVQTCALPIYQYGHSENPVSLKIESLLNHWHAHLMEWMDCGSPVEAAQYVLTVPLNKKVLGGLFWALGSDAREGFDCIRRRFHQRFQVFAARRLMVGCGFDVSK